jgi:hypothetical protein
MHLCTTLCYSVLLRELRGEKKLKIKVKSLTTEVHGVTRSIYTELFREILVNSVVKEKESIFNIAG